MLRLRAIETARASDICGYDRRGAICKPYVHQRLQEQRLEPEIDVIPGVSSTLGQLIKRPLLFESLKHRIVAADCHSVRAVQSRYCRELLPEKACPDG